ncbi:unnamed protein product [Prunus armeniaca]|uniref:Protein kinase domain-containing protein n=1 Tax=Prunus armeniaca TaxID=36596 RepID=A0A6J5UH74_PRUAR|nr:unnamed protein product [Prunus armeniaca]
MGGSSSGGAKSSNKGIWREERSPARASSGASGGRGSSDSGGPKLVMFNNKITLAETIEATRQFDEENVLSRTRYGLVFKACYADGMVLSVRRFPDGALNENLFRKEAEALGRVKHRNLTVLRGYYAGPPNMRLLVYDYIPNGNLATLCKKHHTKMAMSSIGQCATSLHLELLVAWPSYTVLQWCTAM